MAMQTRRYSAKSWSFSYSKLKNYETCPRRHYHSDIAKDFKEDDSENLRWGNAVHAALAKRVGEGVPLPEGMQAYEDWAARVNTALPGAVTTVEHELAISADFQPTAWFGNTTWFRAKADVLQIIPTASPEIDVASLIDWKTGRIEEDSVQLGLAAATVFCHFPRVQKIRTRFVWLKEDADSIEDFTRQDIALMWDRLMPRIDALKKASEEHNYPPKQSHLCKRFCMVTTCEHHGK